MAMHLDRDINSGSQMAVYLEMRSMSSCNRDTPDQFEDAAEREKASRLQIDRAVSTMNKMVQAKEAKSRRALNELLERDGSKLKAYLDRASSLVQMIKELQAAHASGGDCSSIEQELHGALTKHAHEEQPLWTEAEEELKGLARSLHAQATVPATTKDIDGPIDAVSSADDLSSAPSSP